MLITRVPILNWLLTSAILLVALAGVFHTAQTARLPDLDCRQNQTDILQPLDAQTSLTQIIRPASAGFSSLTLYPILTQTDNAAAYTLTLRLEEDTPSAQILLQKSLPLVRLHRGKAIFHFPAQAGSAGRAYRLTITSDAPPGLLHLYASAADRYPQGDLLDSRSQPMPKDLAFSAYYRPSPSVWLKLIVMALPSIAVWLGLTLLFTLAGLAFQFSLNLPAADSLAVFLLQSLGLGFAILIIIGYTQSLLRIPFTSGALLICVLSLLAAVLLRAIHNRPRTQNWSFPRPVREDAFILLLFLASIASRAIQTIGLEPVPLWVDGMNHHVKMAYLVETGFLPLHINYPYGYHLLSTFLHLIAGLNLPAAAFQSGFWISALAAPAAWPLARRLFTRPGPAILAVVLYGFFAPFPAYLAVWSRFPFLLGLTLLPLALDAALQWLTAPSRAIRHELLLAMPSAFLAAALVLSHFGTIVHWAAFLLAWLILAYFDPAAAPLRPFYLKRLAGAAAPAALALALLAFSLIRRGLWQPALTANAAADQTLTLGYTLSLTTQAGGWLVWSLAAVGLLAIPLTRTHRKLALTVILWSLALLLLVILQLKIFGTAISSPTNFILAISFPLSCLAAAALDAVQIPASIKELPARVPAVCLLLLMLVGFASISGMINPVTILFTAQDHQAMNWIRQETSPDAVFLIDSFRWGATFSPANGGGWITAFTGRSAVYPRTADQQADLQAFLTDHPVDYVYAARGLPLDAIPAFDNARPVFQNSRLTIYALP